MNTEPKPKVKSKYNRVLDRVISDYTEDKWQVYKLPQNAINTIIAFNKNKLHFVQIVVNREKNEAKYSGVAKSTFVQNALSNAATPIYAEAVFDATNKIVRIKYTNANTVETTI